MTGAAVTTLWARTLVDELARCGVREAIIAPGSRSTPLVMAMARDERVRVRVHLDERSAAFFALGVGKATGHPAAVVTTSGTAVANLLPAVVEAAHSGVPLLALTADRPHRLRDSDANQAIDQVGIFGSFPRAFFEVAPAASDEPSLRHLRTLAVRAVAAATGPAAGPVHLNLPFDKPLEPAEPDPAPDALEGLEGPAGQSGRRDGEPFTRVLRGTTRLDDGAFSAFAERVDPTRAVVVAGPSEAAGTVGPAVLRFAARTGVPVLADPLSGARYSAAGDAHVVAGYDLFLKDASVRQKLEPSLLIRVGASPTSAALQSWMHDHDGVHHVVIDDGPRWKDHGTLATTYVFAEAGDTLDRLADHLTSGQERVVDEAWARSWAVAHAATMAALEAERMGGAAHEGDAAAAVLAALPPDSDLLVSSSMPVRDLDAFGMPGRERVRVYGNRGASGIDGIVSTAFGIASQRDRPVVCLLGDIAFFHDRNGLLWSRESDAPVVFVLVDNDGGAIFHRLPIAGFDPEFTDLFATPHGVDPAPVAEGHGIPIETVEIGRLTEAVESALGRARTEVVRVQSDRVQNQHRHAEVEETVLRSVRAALG